MARLEPERLANGWKTGRIVLTVNRMEEGVSDAFRWAHDQSSSLYPVETDGYPDYIMGPYYRFTFTPRDPNILNSEITFG